MDDDGGEFENIIEEKGEDDVEEAEAEEEEDEEGENGDEEGEGTPGEETPQEAKFINPLDKYNDQQLIELVTDMDMEKRHLEIENHMFIEFLKVNDPSLLEGVVYDDRKSSDSQMDVSIKSSRKSGSILSSSSAVTDIKGPRVNISHKTDMCLRYIEDINSKLEVFVHKMKRNKRNIRAEMEEFDIREAEIKEAKDLFEFGVVTQGVDKLTQRIPAEKFIRYMEDWLKAASLNIEKLRLRTASLKIQYSKVSTTLIQRQELGENVHAVDFDQLEIENKHFMEKIEQKNLHLLELKKMNGGSNLVLSKHKKYLQKQQQDYNKLTKTIETQEKLTEEIEKETEVVESELMKSQDKYDYYKEISANYRVPETMEYIKLKSDLHEYKKNIKVWRRRKKIQDIGLNACIRQMKNLTGISKVDPTWYDDPEEKEDMYQDGI